MWLRRAAKELLAGYQRQAAGAATRPLPPAAAAAMQQARVHGDGGPEDILDQTALQPFSVAMKQLEEAVTEQLLPAGALAANRAALTTLKEFAASLSNPRGYPPASVKNVQFVFRDPYSGGRLERVRCQLKTTGGNCAQLVQTSLGQLLHRLGLNPYFYFDGDQFRPRAAPQPPPQQQAQVVPKPAAARQGAAAAEPTPEEVEAVRAQAAAAGFPSQTISEEQFRELEQQSEAGRAAKARAEEEAAAAADKMKKIDPLLAAVAAVPWLAGDPGTRDKVAMIKTRVVDEIESWGWDVRGAIRKIWQGERRLAVLQQDKDAGSQLAIKTILFHAVHNDKKYGCKTLAG